MAQFNADKELWPHVSFAEVACRHCGEINMHPATLMNFEKFRSNMGGKPIAILSGYRCPVHNRAVGGAQASYHLVGLALDVAVHPVATLDLARLVAEATRAGFKGFGFYPHKRFTHLDTGPVRFWHGDE